MCTMDVEYLKKNRFIVLPMEPNPQEEAFARDWEKLFERNNVSAVEFLRELCIELNFPVQAGQSENPALLAALKSGKLPPDCGDAWVPATAEGIRVYLHQTPTGRLPVIECAADADFIHLQQSLIYRCEPRDIPDARGATIIKNYNNWARVNLNRTASGEIPKNPALYRDYIALLSHRFYSGVAPEQFGLTEREWRERSLILRREHEVAHYMTQRFYHTAQNEIHDEIIADFMGLTAAFGAYDPAKFLAFLGLEKKDTYRPGGRLELYISGNQPAGEGFAALCEIVRSAAENIAGQYEKTGSDRMETFHTLCHTSVADMARGIFAAGKGQRSDGNEG